MAQFEPLATPSSPPSVSMLQPISMVPEHKDLGEVHDGDNHTNSSIQQQHLQPPQSQQQQDHQALQQRTPSFQSRGGGNGSDEATEVAIMEEVTEDEDEPRCATPASSPYPYPSHGHGHGHQQRRNSSGGRYSDPGPPPPPPAAVSSDEDDHYTLLQSWSGEVVFPVPAVICGNSDSSSTGSRRRSLPTMPNRTTLKNLGIKIASPLKGALSGGNNNNGDPTSNNRSPGNSFKGGKNGGTSPGGQNLNTSHHSKASSVGASSPPRRRGAQGAVPRNAVSVSSFSQQNDFSPHVLLTWSLEKAHDGPIWAAKFSPGGRYLATAGEDGKILVWAVGVGRGKGKGAGAGAGAGAGGGSGGGGPGSGSGARDPSSSAAAGGGGGGRRSSTMAVAPGMATDKVAAARAKKFSQRRVMKELNGQQSSFTQGGDGPAIGTEIKLLSSEPIQRFQEHTGDVIDLSWSPGPESDFLLSASLDKTVRLWHVSKPRSLQVFPHDDLVTSVDFHPVDDEYFVSAGLDKKLRLWSTTRRSVRAWAQAPEAVTAARFAPTPPGGGGGVGGGQTQQATVVAGLIKGQVYFYKCSTPRGGPGGGGAPGGVSSGASVTSVASGATSMGTAAPTLKYHTQILCRNRQGTHSEGRKVTGLSFRTISPGGITAAQLRERSYSDDAEDVSGGHQLPMDQMSAPCTVSSPPRVVRVGSNASSPGAGNAATTSRRAHQQLLVTTNDSRLRVIGLDDYFVIHKYKGTANTTMQIKASYSESGNNIISGSEVGNVHVWDSSQDQYLGGTKIANHKSYDRSSTCASFVASTSKLAHLKPVVTCAVFAPTRSVEAALIASNLFPTLDSFDHINHDISSSMMVSCDYEGTIRVFLKKSTLDVLFYEAGPEGSKFRDIMR